MTTITLYYPRLTQQLVPFFPVPVPCGPSREIEQGPERINLHEYLNAGAIYPVIYGRANGDSMRDAGICDGDIIVIERTETARPDDIVVAEVNGEFTVKRIRQHTHGLYLVPANDDYPIRRVERSDTFGIWGIVRGVVRKFRRAA